MPDTDVLAADRQGPNGPGDDHRGAPFGSGRPPRRWWPRWLAAGVILAVTATLIPIMVERRLTAERYDPLSFGPVILCCNGHPGGITGPALSATMQIIVGPGNQGFYADFEMTDNGASPVHVDGVGEPQFASLANLMTNLSVRLVDERTLRAARPFTMPFRPMSVAAHQRRFLEIDGDVSGCPPNPKARIADLSGLTVYWTGRGFHHATWLPLHVTLALQASPSCAT